MTRITSYNILAGGYDLRTRSIEERTEQLTTIIRSTQSDIVGMAEAINPLVTRHPLVIEKIAQKLDMQLVLGSDPKRCRDYQTALMTRLPIIYEKVHFTPEILTRPVLEVCVEEANGQQLVVFVVHLSAAFNKGWAGNSIRMREVREILRITAQVQDRPHVIMGDFNSMAPGDAFKASFLLRYLAHIDSKQHTIGVIDGHPHLNVVVPRPLRFLTPILYTIPRSGLLSTLFDGMASIYAPRGPIVLMQSAGYTDCYRHAEQRAFGFTCPSAAPAGRIDFIFASPALAERLETCAPVVSSGDVMGSQASDHLAVAANFGPGVQEQKREVSEVHETVS